MISPQYVCRRCGAPVQAEQIECGRCGIKLDAPTINAWLAENPTIRPHCSVTERETILEQVIIDYARSGWRLVGRLGTAAQLTADKPADGCVGVLLLLLGIIPGILYFALYKGTQNLFIEIDERGQVRATRQ